MTPETRTMRDLLVAFKCDVGCRPIEYLARRRGHESPVSEPPAWARGGI